MVRDGHPDTLARRHGALRNLPQSLSNVIGAPNLRIADLRTKVAGRRFEHRAVARHFMAVFMASDCETGNRR